MTEIAIKGELSVPQSIKGTISVPQIIFGELQLGGRLPSYTGDYEVTPSPETQVLQTDHKSLSQNIVINPIPSNYGLIGWNGSYLTVS